MNTNTKRRKPANARAKPNIDLNDPAAVEAEYKRRIAEHPRKFGEFHSTPPFKIQRLFLTQYEKHPEKFERAYERWGHMESEIRQRDWRVARRKRFKSFGLPISYRAKEQLEEKTWELLSSMECYVEHCRQCGPLEQRLKELVADPATAETWMLGTLFFLKVLSPLHIPIELWKAVWIREDEELAKLIEERQQQRAAKSEANRLAKVQQQDLERLAQLEDPRPMDQNTDRGAN